MPALPIDTSQIVITASRIPSSEDQTPASVAIFDQEEIIRLDKPAITDLVRLTPSAAIATSGPAGSLTEVRIRGAEANHTLFFVDGIKLNDPASGDTPRFELLNADLVSRVEVLRGPQSALWGSDAIGGVIAVNGVDEQPGYHVGGEAGSFGFRRASVGGGYANGPLRIALGVGWQRATGIDSFGSPGGDKDGFRNFSGRARGNIALVPSIRLVFTGLLLRGTSEFDGYNLLTFVHEDTLDISRNRLNAGRAWLDFGRDGTAWRGHVGVTLLGSSNRNLLDNLPINLTKGTRRLIDAQIDRSFKTGLIEHQFILAGEAEREGYLTRDFYYGGFSDQDRKRSRQALTAEWRASAKVATSDIAVRRDIFSGFRDATSVRASVLAPFRGGFSLTAGYATGIAQPTFVEQFGFFPGTFVGNSALKPERSAGIEASLRYRSGPFGGALTAYRQRLKDEIVDVYDPLTGLDTSVNRLEDSHRSGIEAEAFTRLGPWLNLRANYAFLHATEPPKSGSGRLTEARRPRHSGALMAEGNFGRWSYGGSIAYVGKRRDNQDNFPFAEVTLHKYWLTDARVAYALRPGIELFMRGSNLVGANYQDAAGYNTEGRGIFAGIRLAGRRSSP